ncbi:hypothetical protein QYE76_006930 [Lolium multiflorum]|uniref:Diacylglycerol O-acyltransferase n=1 Tax=Lolium multiflorum TaxID=4521 RepID=A0AAD8RVN0_LOLMU|nr:hypothetical protein QYE76_006930 [Lolium multiflorum]
MRSGSPSAAALRSRPLSIRTKPRAAPAAAAGADESAAEGEPLSPTSRLVDNLYIVVTIGLGSRLNQPAFSAGISRLIAPHPRFNSIQVTDGSEDGNPRWVRVKVKVEDHIVVPALDAAAVAADPDKALEDYVASLSTLPMARSRPLWEFHFLDFPTSEREVTSTVAIRIHHSLGDGASLMMLLLASARSAADPASLPAMPTRAGAIYARRPRSAGGALAFAALVWSYVVLAWNTVVDLWCFAAMVLFSRGEPHTAPAHTVFSPAADRGVLPEHHNNNRRRFVHRSLCFDDVIFIKNTMNCTVNDVLIGVTSAALSRYYFRKSGGTNTKDIFLRSVIAVNTRPLTSLQVYADMIESGKNNEAAWGNQIGYILLRFHLAMCNDPLAYVRKANKTMDRKKNSLEVAFTHKMCEFFLNTFGLKGGAFIFGGMAENTTIAFSNMVGPTEQIDLYGHPVVFIAPSVYGVPQPVIVHYQSYDRIIKVILSINDQIFPDYRELLDDFAVSFENIMDAASKLST